MSGLSCGEGASAKVEAEGWRALALELRPTLRLAGPVVLAELGWMAMGVVDLVMVGHLGPDAIGAVGLGNILFFTATVFGLGLLMGLDTLVSQSFGAGRVDDCHRWLVQGGYLAIATTPVLMILLLGALPYLNNWGLAPEVIRLTGPYVRIVAWSTLPLLLFFAVRRYLQAMNLVRVATATLILANFVNVAANWALINGRLGLPALGVAGSAWATLISRGFLLAVLGTYAVGYSIHRGTGLLATPLRPEFAWLRRLTGLGLPAGCQMLLEVGVFGAAALLAGRLGSTALAAHEVVMHAAGVTYMVPLGISAAGSVRVGQALGRGEPDGAARAGWVAMGLGAAFMVIPGLSFLLIPHAILSVFTTDELVVTTALPLLAMAAMFQLFDGVQVVATGTLRGSGDTKTSMLVNLASHWGIGLPTGALFAFVIGWGVLGVWVGLCVGLTIAGLCLGVVWARVAIRLRGQATQAIAKPIAESDCVHA